jgi:hypothetical protein
MIRFVELLINKLMNEIKELMISNIYNDISISNCKTETQDDLKNYQELIKRKEIINIKTNTIREIIIMIITLDNELNKKGEK